MYSNFSTTLNLIWDVRVIRFGSALKGEIVIIRFHSRSDASKPLSVIDGLDREDINGDHIYDKIGSGEIGPEYEEVTPNVNPPSGLQHKPTDRRNKVQS